MGDFRSGSRGGFGGRAGGSRFGGGRSFGDRDSGRFERRPLEMHDVTCDKCQKRCQVPFKPSGDKPVFCSECFRNEGAGNSFGSRDRGDRGRPERSSSSGTGMTSDQFKILNVKLDKIIDILNTLEIDSDDDDLDDDEDSEVEVAASDEELTDDKENDKDVKDDDLDDDELDDDSDEEVKTA